MKTFVFGLAMTAALSANATKVFMGVFETSGPFASIVTAILRPCDQSDGNAMVVNGDTVTAGCWQEQGDKVIVKRLDGTFLASFDKSGFKLVADKGVAQSLQPTQPTSDPSKSPPKTLLNCIADAWVGDVEVERDQDGRLKSVMVAGALVESKESGSSINFSFNNLNITLSSVTGIFSYESTAFSKLLSGTVRRGTGRCTVINSAKKF